MTAKGKTPSSATKTLQIHELAKLRILRNVDLEYVRGLLEHCPVTRLQPGEKLLHAGQINQTLYMILSGKFSVHLDDLGGEPVAFLEAGQTVGEVSVIDNSPASADVLAVTECRLIAVEEDIFWRLVEISHEFAANLLLLLAQRMRANNFAISENSRQKKHYKIEAMVDRLTGLHNRRWLEENMHRIFERHVRDKSPLSILMLDVDHFKQFNDSHGHAAGDHALKTVARVLMTNVRPTDLSARYGGEEFIVFLPDANLTEACSIAERIRKAASGTAITASDGADLPAVTVSIGVARANRHETDAELFARADAALYRAKRSGRNRVEH